MSDNSSKDNEGQKHEAVGFVSKPFGFNYNFKDVITYNLGVGASIKDKHGLQWLYEGHENFGPIPSYAVIPPFAGKRECNVNVLTYTTILRNGGNFHWSSPWTRY